MNAFDFVATIALGSILATIPLNRHVSLLAGVAAIILLVVLPHGIARPSVRYRVVEPLAKSDARALLVDGVIDHAVLKRERVTRDEVLLAIRSAGFGDLEMVAAVVLETESIFRVVARDKAGW